MLPNTWFEPFQNVQSYLSSCKRGDFQPNLVTLCSAYLPAGLFSGQSLSIHLKREKISFFIITQMLQIRPLNIFFLAFSSSKFWFFFYSWKFLRVQIFQEWLNPTLLTVHQLPICFKFSRTYSKMSTDSSKQHSMRTYLYLFAQCLH